MSPQNPGSRGNLPLRGGAASLGAALSQLATRRKSGGAPPAPSPHQPAPEGPRWGPLVLLEKAGEGAFGEVYRAWDVNLEREVALKLLRAADEDPALLQEARMLARLRHPNVVTVYGVDRHDGRSGVWMDFVEGDTLDAILEERGSFGAMEALLVGLDICRALAAVHQSGLLHRDIKAQNVMRERGGRIVLMDFGLGHDAAKTGAPAEFGGTPLYMAPELFLGQPASVASDLYSAGVLVFHLVTRDYPVEGATLEALRAAHASGAVKTLRDLRPELAAGFVRAVEKAIARDPSRRYATAGQMAAALETALTSRRFSIPMSRRTFGWTAASLAAIGGVAVWRVKRGSIKYGSSLLVAEISNITGDPQLNAVADVLRVQLAQSARFNLLDNERIKEVLGQMTRPPDQRLDVGTAREVAFRSGTPLLIYGTLSPVGIEYSLNLVLETIEGQPQPRENQHANWTAKSKTALFDAIHDAANWIRASAGEAGKDISGADTRPEEATTSSWEALDYFTQGERLKAQNRADEAMSLYKQAVRIDPGFALAMARLAGQQSTQRQLAESFVWFRKAVDALDRRRMTRREDLRIRGLYNIQTENYAAAEELLQALTIRYPLDWQAHHYRALALRNLGRLDEAYKELQVSQKLRPSEPTRQNLIVVALLLGRPAEAASYLPGLRPAAISLYQCRVKFLAHDFEGAEAAITSALKTADSRIRSLAYGAQAAFLSETGRRREAAQSLEQGIAADTTAGNAGEQALKRLALAHLNLAAGDNRAARTLALEAVRQDADTSSLLRAGSLLARAGFLADARSVQARMDAPDEGRRFETAQRRLEAEIALADGRIEGALSGLSKADSLTAPIRPREFLARGLEKAGRREEALAAWRRIASNPQLVWSEPPDYYDPGVWSESLLRVADLSLRTGLREEARTALDQLFRLFRHADSDTPEYLLARQLLETSQR